MLLKTTMVMSFSRQHQYFSLFQRLDEKHSLTVSRYESCYLMNE